MPGRLGRHGAVVRVASIGHAGDMTTQSMPRPAEPAAPPLVRTLVALFAVTLAVGIAATYLMAAVRPSMFV